MSPKLEQRSEGARPMPFRFREPSRFPPDGHTRHRLLRGCSGSSAGVLTPRRGAPGSRLERPLPEEHLSVPLGESSAVGERRCHRVGKLRPRRVRGAGAARRADARSERHENRPGTRCLPAARVPPGPPRSRRTLTCVCRGSPGSPGRQRPAGRPHLQPLLGQRPVGALQPPFCDNDVAFLSRSVPRRR